MGQVRAKSKHAKMLINQNVIFKILIIHLNAVDINKNHFNVQSSNEGSDHNLTFLFQFKLRKKTINHNLKIFALCVIEGDLTGQGMNILLQMF